MSFDRERSIIGQNAGTTAANLLASYRGDDIDGGSLDEYLDVFETVRRRVFDGTLELAGETASAIGVSDVVREFPGTTVEAPAGNKAGYKFTSGKHQGKTIAEVDSIPAGGQNRDGGRGYLEWYAQSGPQENVKKAVQAYLAAA